MQPLIRRWLGEDRPKQFCTFSGARSMLQHTLDRVAQLVPADQTVTVLGCGQHTYLDNHDTAFPGALLEQPSDCGTAAGIMLPATHIMARDPTATALIFPSDHFIYPPERFLETLWLARALVTRYKDRLVLLAATADRPEPDYGWIVTGEPVCTTSCRRPAPAAYEALAFLEKPDPTEAQKLLEKGGLWNTMIVAVRVKTLWRLAWQLIPEMMSCFEPLLHMERAVQTLQNAAVSRKSALKATYAGMRSYDFSRDVLQRVVSSTLVVPMRGVEWSDWGRPERIVQSLERLGKAPAFPAEAAVM
jgi:mannose-1-phosphate guanylyltransferase